MAGVIKCHNGYKVSWKIDDFKFLHKSLSAYENSPQILESGLFKILDCNWKFKLILEEKSFSNSIRFLSVSTSLEVLDVESWDKKGLSIAASLNAYHKGGDKSQKKKVCSEKLKDYKITNDGVFSFSSITDRIIHNFDFNWFIWLDVTSAHFERHFSNAKRIKLMVNKWGLMLDDTESHDVKIQCQGVELTAHKLVLSGSSSVFKAMFQADMKETRESQVEVTVGTPEAVKVMLRWIYTGEIEENEPQALDLLKLAHYYDLADLMEECQLILVDTLSKENAIEMLNEADLLGAKELKDSAIQFIIRNKSDFKEDFEKKLKQKLVAEILMAT